MDTPGELNGEGWEGGLPPHPIPVREGDTSIRAADGVGARWTDSIQSPLDRFPAPTWTDAAAFPSSSVGQVTRGAYFRGTVLGSRERPHGYGVTAKAASYPCLHPETWGVPARRGMKWTRLVPPSKTAVTLPCDPDPRHGCATRMRTLDGRE